MNTFESIVFVLLLFYLLVVTAVYIEPNISLALLARNQYLLSEDKVKPTKIIFKHKEIKIYIEKEYMDNSITNSTMVKECVYYMNDIPVMSLSEFKDDISLLTRRALTYNKEYDTQDVMKILKKVKRQYHKNNQSKLKEQFY